MPKYAKETKEEIISLYLSNHDSMRKILEVAGILKSTFYSWLNKHTASEISPDTIEFTLKNFRILTNKVTRLESIIEILKVVECTAHAPLDVKLSELERLHGKYSIHALCDALDVSRGTFYNYIYRNKRDNTWYSKRREILKTQIQDIYDESRQRFGSGKITAVLRSKNINVSPEMVRQLMNDMGIISIRQGAKDMYDKENQKYKNHINQQFDTKTPNEVWISDVTYFKSKNKSYYICVIIDLFSRMVVACNISYRNSTQLVKMAFRQAYTIRNPGEGLIYHTDCGMNYKSKAVSDYLNLFNVTQSFSRAYVPYKKLQYKTPLQYETEYYAKQKDSNKV